MPAKTQTKEQSRARPRLGPPTAEVRLLLKVRSFSKEEEKQCALTYRLRRLSKKAYGVERRLGEGKASLWRHVLGPSQIVAMEALDDWSEQDLFLLMKSIADFESCYSQAVEEGWVAAE